MSKNEWSFLKYRNSLLHNSHPPSLVKVVEVIFFNTSKAFTLGGKRMFVLKCEYLTNMTDLSCYCYKCNLYYRSLLRGACYRNGSLMMKHLAFQGETKRLGLFHSKKGRVARREDILEAVDRVDGEAPCNTS